jgi:hypothetical protein
MPAAWDALTGGDSPRFWARKALTGSGESTTPTGGELDPVLAIADALLQSRYPCVGTTPWEDLTGTELTGWAQAVGYQAAAQELRGAQGASYARLITEQKQGTVTKKWATGQQADPQSLAKSAEKLSGQGLSLIACIREGRAAANDGQLFSVAGRRKLIGSQHTIEGRVLGRDAKGNLP